MDVEFPDIPKKVPWKERYKIIGEYFPRAVKLDWHEAFRDVELWGNLLQDLIKLDDTKPGRSGPRPIVPREIAEQRLKQMLRTDFSDLEFRDAFDVLREKRSIRSIAAKTGLDRNMVQRLLSGEKEPDLQLMEQIAIAFKKQPAYFLEWRTAYVLGALESRMMTSPEMTTDLYRRLRPRKS